MAKKRSIRSDFHDARAKQAVWDKANPEHAKVHSDMGTGQEGADHWKKSRKDKILRDRARVKKETAEGKAERKERAGKIHAKEDAKEEKEYQSKLKHKKEDSKSDAKAGHHDKKPAKKPAEKKTTEKKTATVSAPKKASTFSNKTQLQKAKEATRRKKRSGLMKQTVAGT